MTLRDLQAAGTLGLISACRLFDTTRRIAFVTYATYRIRGAMMDEMRRFGFPAHTMTLPMEVLNGEVPWSGDEGARPSDPAWEGIRLQLCHAHLVPDAQMEAAPELPVIAGLGEDDVWILWRRFINRAPLKEVAADLGCKPRALQWRIKILVRRLRGMYDGILGDSSWDAAKRE